MGVVCCCVTRSYVDNICVEEQNDQKEFSQLALGHIVKLGPFTILNFIKYR